MNKRFISIVLAFSFIALSCKPSTEYKIIKNSDEGDLVIVYVYLKDFSLDNASSVFDYVVKDFRKSKAITVAINFVDRELPLKTLDWYDNDTGKDSQGNMVIHQLPKGTKIIECFYGPRNDYKKMGTVDEFK